MPARRKQPFFARLSDAELLGMRICDLGVELAGSDVEPAVEQLYAELEGRGLHFRPYVWVSNDWFSVDRVCGFAVPFYLTHRRLRELERSQMLDVEGGTHDWCMRILRHEAGHAIDNAYRLHLRKQYRKLFGPYHRPYPDQYRPRPVSWDHVVHLDMWYAQAHPAEDFAETFAVWLNPRSRWRQAYRHWPALKKLQYVDQLMHLVQGRRPGVRSRRRVRPVEKLTMTLGEHYAQKRAAMGNSRPQFYDRDLWRLFSNEPRYGRRMSAAEFVQEAREEVRMMVSRWTGETQFTVDRTLADILQRVRQLRLRLVRPAQQTKVDLTLMVAVQTMNYLNDMRHRVVL